MHNRAANLLAFAVNEERLRGMASGFQGKPARADVPELLFWMAILGALGLCLWLASRWLYRSERRYPYDSPRRLFRTLCRAHHLGAADRRILERLAQQHGLLNPARIFLEPERFDMETPHGNAPLAAVADGSGLNDEAEAKRVKPFGQHDAGQDRARLDDLRQKLFGGR